MLPNPVMTDTVALDQFQTGVALFSRLFARWMDRNGWSHPTMTALAKGCLGGAGWLHSSQISGLRHGRLRSPGPRTFIAIERLNYYLWRYQTEKKLLPGSTSSNYYAEPFVILENGQPPSVGWWVEVFCGIRQPEDAQYLNQVMFTLMQAERFSDGYGRYLRHLLALAQVDVIDDLNVVLKEHYPITDPHRREKLRSVILANAVWTGDELASELPYLLALTQAYGGASTESELLAELG
jgi:hypothetical protein